MLGLSSEELYALTPRQFRNAQIGMLRFHNPEAAKELLAVKPTQAENQDHLIDVWNKIDRLKK